MYVNPGVSLYAEPRWYQFPHFIPLFRCPQLQTPRTGFTLRELRTLQLPKFLCDIQRIIASFLSVKQVMLRRQLDELLKVLAARRARDTYLAGQSSPVSCHPARDTQHSRAGAGVEGGEGTLRLGFHALDQRCDGVEGGFFSDSETCGVVC